MWNRHYQELDAQSASVVDAALELVRRPVRRISAVAPKRRSFPHPAEHWLPGEAMQLSDLNPGQAGEEMADFSLVRKMLEKSVWVCCWYI